MYRNYFMYQHLNNNVFKDRQITDYCGNTCNIYTVKVLNNVFSLSCDGAVQREETKVCFKLNVRRSILYSLNNNNK